MEQEYLMNGKNKKESLINRDDKNPLGTYYRFLCSPDKENICTIGLNNPDVQANDPKSTVWACRYGWLLVSQEEHSESHIGYQFSVWKPEAAPAAECLIKLPPLHLKPCQRIDAGTLVNSPPGNPSCMVLLFERVLGYLIFYRLGDKEWTQITENFTGHHVDEDFIEAGCVAYCDGTLYGVTAQGRKFMVIEENTAPANNRLKLRPLKSRGRARLPSTFTSCICTSRYLLGFCGNLFAIEVALGGVNYEEIIDIGIFKLVLNGNKNKNNKWVKVKSAQELDRDGDRAIFLSDKYAFSCPAHLPAEIEGGCIYLFKNKRLYSYNIEENRISVSMPLKNYNSSASASLIFLTMSDFPQAKLQGQLSSSSSSSDKDQDPDEEEGRNNICDLPFDILKVISKKLYLVDYINFRSVCNTFRQLVPPIKHREEALSKLEIESQPLCPWLIYSKPNSYPPTHYFIDPQLGSKYIFKFKIPVCFLDAQIRNSKDGWLLICHPNFMLFYHPFTTRILKLVDNLKGTTPDLNRCFGYALSSSPASPDCILVGSGSCLIYCFLPREEVWYEFSFPDYFDFIFKMNHNSPVYFDGAFYFLNGDGELGVFTWNYIDVNAEPNWEILTHLHCPCDTFGYNYLLECDGNLLSVFVDDQLVHVYKLIFSTVMAWDKVTNLGNHALFVSPSTSFSVIPNSSDMENKVYFPNLFGQDIVYYCLRTQKFYTCGNKQVLADFRNTTHYCNSSWIEPRW